MDDIKIGTTVELLTTILNLPDEKGFFYSFRGVQNYSWKNLPGIMRNDNKSLFAHENSAVRDLISAHPQEFENDSSMFSKLVRMQHFNLPTRLLDVTNNPLVALYFSTEISQQDDVDGAVIYYKIPIQRMKYFDSDTVSCIANVANLSESEKDEIFNWKGKNLKDFNELHSVKRLLQFIRAEKPYFTPDIKLQDLKTVWYVIPKLNNRRIIAQQGAFLLYGFEKYETLKDHPIKPDFIIIDKDKKKKIRLELNRLSIEGGSLFPEISHAAIDIIKRYKK